ncbi:response regulator [Marinobacterium jannaschii]|uniref:response regulator n=1 Tax=Marinobacterium jannaschii TaxID=64970 RepID=UPI000687F05F|nr:HD domain-containing phosphohydrolase [Marinobacterium jannaschii]
MNSLEKILVVDDAENILHSFKRQFRKKYQVFTAMDGVEGLEQIEQNGPFALIVSDMKMPRMNGAEFLGRVREQYPNTVRILLTGQADMQSAIEAVNRGQIFRFMTKPSAMDDIAHALEAGLEHHRLQRMERELLDKTLKGTIALLVEMLSQINPALFSHGVRVKRYIRHLADAMELSQRWEFEIAAMLSELGAVALEDSLLNKIANGEILNSEEKQLMMAVPHQGALLIEKVPRLSRVARMVRYQKDNISFSGDAGKLTGDDRALLGGHMIKVVLEYDRLLANGCCHAEAIAWLERKEEEYHPEVVRHLATLSCNDDLVTKLLPLGQLAVGMVLDQDLLKNDSSLILAKGYEISEAMLLRIQIYTYNQQGGDQRVRVLVPAPVETPEEQTEPAAS